MTIKRRMSSEERRTSIIEAAITIISRTSFERCTTALIAREAGVSEPMIYRHFKSKKDLQIAVLDTILKDMSVFLDNNIRTLPSITLAEIRDHAEQFKNLISNNPKKIDVLLKGFALEDERAREKIWEILKSLHGAMKTILEKLPVREDINHDALINMLSWVSVSWITVTSTMNLLGKLGAIPEDLIDSRLAFIDDIINGRIESPFNIT